jgi:hypothetical protein
MKTVIASVNGFDGLVLVIIVLVICVGLFLALRALVLWYWQIDKVVSNQEKQIMLLKDIIASINKKDTIVMVILGLLTFSSPTFGQIKEKNLTDAEQFSLTTGTLIERSFVEAGSIKGIHMQIITFKDLNSGNSQSALRFEVMAKGSYSTTEKSAAIDLEEINDLTKAIRNLQANVFPTTRPTYTEVNFKSKTGFEAGAYYQRDKSKWTAYVQIDKYDRDSMVFLNTDDFVGFLKLIEAANEKMKN